MTIRRDHGGIDPQYKATLNPNRQRPLDPAWNDDRVSLAKLCARAVEYVQRAPAPSFLAGHATNSVDVMRGGSY